MPIAAIILFAMAGPLFVWEDRIAMLFGIYEPGNSLKSRRWLEQAGPLELLKWSLVFGALFAVFL